MLNYWIYNPLVHFDCVILVFLNRVFFGVMVLFLVYVIGIEEYMVCGNFLFFNIHKGHINRSDEGAFGILQFHFLRDSSLFEWFTFA